jgi:hypothetical protein
MWVVLSEMAGQQVKVEVRLEACVIWNVIVQSRSFLVVR